MQLDREPKVSFCSNKLWTTLSPDRVYFCDNNRLNVVLMDLYVRLGDLRVVLQLLLFDGVSAFVSLFAFKDYLYNTQFTKMIIVFGNHLRCHEVLFCTLHVANFFSFFFALFLFCGFFASANKRFNSLIYIYFNNVIIRLVALSHATSKLCTENWIGHDVCDSICQNACLRLSFDVFFEAAINFNGV